MTDEFRFAYPFVFLLFIPASVILFLWLRGNWRRSPAVLRYSDTRILSGISPTLRTRLRATPDILRLVAWVLCVFVLARPQAGEARQIIRGSGIDIVMALDISNSMSTPDLSDMPRINAARNITEEFIIAREFDQIGLVTFADEAYYIAPLTLDHMLVRRQLANVRLADELGLSNRTAIGMGIGSAANMLRDSASPGKVIILLTDGANNAGNLDPGTAAEAAYTLGIRIYTIGIGQAGQGDLDEDGLRSIARVADGQYFNAATLPDLERIYANIDRLEQGQRERELTIRWQDQTSGLILVILLCLISERVLRHTIFQTIP